MRRSFGDTGLQIQRPLPGLRGVDAIAIEHLREAAAGFERIGARVDLARCLLDLGRAERRAGQDARPTFERARELLVACDARYFLPEADAELAGS